MPNQSMRPTLKCLVGASLLALVTAECRADPPPKNPYSTMAPLEQYPDAARR